MPIYAVMIYVTLSNIVKYVVVNNFGTSLIQDATEYRVTDFQKWRNHRVPLEMAEPWGTYLTSWITQNRLWSMKFRSKNWSIIVGICQESADPRKCEIETHGSWPEKLEKKKTPHPINSKIVHIRQEFQQESGYVVSINIIRIICLVFMVVPPPISLCSQSPTALIGWGGTKHVDKGSCNCGNWFFGGSSSVWMVGYESDGVRLLPECIVLTVKFDKDNGMGIFFLV